MLDPTPLIFDRIRALSVSPAASPHYDLHRFDVRVEHDPDGGEPIEHIVKAEITSTGRIQVQGDVAEYVARYVERVGNSFQNDGFKLKNLLAYEPIVVYPEP